MSLAQTIRDAVDSGVDALGDVAENLRFTFYGNPTYDAATDTMTPNVIKTGSVRSVVTKWAAEELRDFGLLPTDLKIVASASVFIVQGVEPLVGTDVVRVELDPTQKMRVVQMQRMPGGTAYVLAARMRADT